MGDVMPRSIQKQENERVLLQMRELKQRLQRGKINEPVIEKEADEFLKFIKHSEYSIVEQLHKLLTKISLLALMLNFESHGEAMLKVLKQAYVPHNAPIDKISRLVGNIMMDNYISFYLKSKILNCCIRHASQMSYKLGSFFYN